MARPKRDSASLVMQRLNFDPLKKLIEHANILEKNNPKDPALREVCLNLMPYAYAKIKQVDHNLSGSASINVTIGATSPNDGGDSSDDEG